MGLISKARKELRRFDDRVRETGRDIDDQVRAAASDADDWRRENPILSAMIPFTPENQALMATGGALLAGGSALGGLIGSGFGAAGAAGAGGATGLGSLGQLGLGLGQIGAGIYGAKQAGKASKAQIEAGNYAAQLEKESADAQLALQKQIWEKQQADQLPYLQQGQAAIGKLGSLMGLKQKMTPQEKGNAIISVLTGGGNPSPIESNNVIKNYNTLDNPLGDPFKDYLAKSGLSGGQFNQNNPQYQFLLKQGQQALDRSAAARGMGYSGAQMKAAQQFGQGLASQQYDKEYDRAAQEFGNYYNRLAALAQGGQQAATTASQLGGQYAQNAGGTLGSLSTQLQNNIGQLGNARASGYIGQANAITGGLQNITDNMFRAASLFYPKGIT